MAGVEVPIPLVALAVGTHSYGPASVDDLVTSARIMVDRTVNRPGAPGLNAQPPTTTVELTVLQSNDGGASWQLRASAGLVGGTYASEGVPFTFSDVQVELAPGAARRVRADVTVAGDRVAVAGSLTIT